MEPLFLLIDGNSLAYRHYYAHAHGDGIRSASGLPISATRGFVGSLVKAIQSHRPSHVAIAFDTQEETFRKKKFPGYKAGRSAAPEKLVQEMDILQELLKLMKITLLLSPGYEADDAIATATRIIVDFNKMPVYILTSDRDLLQLVDDEKQVAVLLIRQDGIQCHDAAVVKENFGILPTQVCDWKGLCGDPSDGIRGVPGIGQKTTERLLAQYRSIEQIYDYLEEMSANIGKKLEAGRESAKLSKSLAELCSYAPLLDFSVDRCRVSSIAIEEGGAAESRLQELSMFEFASKLRQAIALAQS